MVQRRLLFDPDFRADPLWDYDTGSMVDLDQLPISAGLRQRLRGWAQQWDVLSERQLTADDIEAGMLSGVAEPPSEAQWSDHHEEMNRLWRLLLSELGPSWRIGVAEDIGQTRFVRWSPDGEPEAVHESAGRRFWSPADDPRR